MPGNRVRPRSLLTAAAAVAAFGMLAWAERKRALRERTVPASRRTLTNLALAGVTAAISTVAMRPVAVPLARRVARRRIGLVQRLPLPEWARDISAIILMDYTLYWWHVVEHRVPWLYRFHRVHHADLDLDTSTALRFHFGEFLASVPWRAAQILIIGTSPRALTIWESLTGLSVLFHHSNISLPVGFERRLARGIITPRLHGIHHSVVAREQDSNWSSVLTLWDRLHGTFRGNVPQGDITIGVPALREARDVAFARSLAMPFAPQEPWRLPNGQIPERSTGPRPPERLLP